MKCLKRSIPPTLAAPGAAGLLAAAALLALPLAPASAAQLTAHDEAVIESARSSVPAGDVLTLTGKDFTAGESYALRLLGALSEYDLGEVEPEEDGTFELELSIPVAVSAGAYQLVAVAGDGDEVARMDLHVLAPNTMADDQAGAAHEGSGARSDDIRIERDRSGLEWGAIGLLVGLAGGLGVGLLRRGEA